MVAAMLVTVAAAAAASPSGGEPLPYTYTISRPGVEKRSGSLCDGNAATGVSWHTKERATTDIVCEFRETADLERVELLLPKHTKWYIVNELRVSVDDGIGGFGDPFVLPGLVPSPHGQKEIWDASCTNHVFSLSHLGRAVRVKVTVLSDAAASVSEIRFLGKAAVPGPTHEGAPAVTFAKKRENLKRMENANWRLEFIPLGGRAVSVYSKAIDAELTNAAGDGSFVEEVWDRRTSHDFLIAQPYVMTYGSAPGGGIVATATGNAQGGGIDFLKVVKRYSAFDDSTALKVDYHFENIPEAMALQSYGILVHATLGVFGRDVTCYYPTLDGILAIEPGKRGNDRWMHRPARGWMAAATDDGTGVAVTMPFRDVKTFYSWFSQVPTLEWRMIPIGLEAGAGYSVSTEVIPFKGLKPVSGAGGGFVGSLANGLCKVVSSRAGKVVAEMDGKSAELSFAKPGDTVSFATDATTVVLRHNGAEICRLEAPPKNGAWMLAPTEVTRESSVKEADLNCYTNFPHTACVPWGRPLAGSKLRVAVLTGNGNQIELGRLVDRFDMEFRTVGVMLASGYSDMRRLGNPIFSDGDNFSLINTGDLERGITTVLKYDADVILVGGVPFEALTKDLRKLLVDKVNGGTGLVWIGQDRDVPELGFKLKNMKTSKLVPQAKGRAFSSVPFSVLGAEEVYAIDAPQDAAVHAICGETPYLMETKLGKGRVINIAYRALSDRPWSSAGLTPANTRDFYETRTAPVEHYYSLIAKALLAAAGRTLPVAFGEFSVAQDVRSAKGGAKTSLRLCVSAGESKKSVWAWRVVDPFGRVVASGKRDVVLAVGGQSVSFDSLAVPPTQGPLVFEVVVRDAESFVQNWGAWTFSNEPKAVIDSLKLDDMWHVEGDEVAYDVIVKGELSGLRLAVSLMDSYGRVVAEDSAAAQAYTTGRFKIANALSARCYTVDAKLCTSNGAFVSRRRAELRVRPASSKYVWDDFEVGTWANAANREYLWPDLADIYGRIGISTIIANPNRVAVDFAMRYNIHPTLLSDAGLHRASEPKEYSNTGDKMKLVRPTCLSSPEFFAKRTASLASVVKALPRYGMRFVWFGDEQSITGYGGTPVDFCFSAHCLRELRTFLKGRYDSLERLNEEWETEFSEWEAVVPFTRQEVWEAGGRHVAGWADHLEFMDARLTNSIAFSVRAMHAADPAVKFALSGTQQPSAYGGMDWWKILGVMDAALNYRYGGQFDMHRSFCPDGGFMPWNWGYAKCGDAGVADVWATAFYGMRGIMGFQSSSQINSDWTFSQGLRDTLPHIRRLATGTGLHFVNNLKTRHDVAILYSQASLRAAFIENRREEHDRLEEKMRRLMLNLGYAYDYVSYDQLANGVAASRGYKVLVLADALAMSNAEVAGVKAFAAGGGTVIAEGMPATRAANCRKRTVSPLVDLFKGVRHSLFPKIDVGYLKAIDYPEKPENAPVIELERNRYGAALECAGVQSGGLGIVDEEMGKSIVNAMVYPKTDGAGNGTWCVLAPSSGKDRHVKFTFPESAWTYDLVSGRAYGRVKALRLPFRHGMPYAFAQYPEKVMLAEPMVDGSRISMAYTTPVDGAVHIDVVRPDGIEARCYAKNVLMKAGRATHEIPFALSDPPGVWRIRVTSIFGGEVRECAIHRNIPPRSVHLSRELY